MIWTTWRQHRAEVLVGLVGLVGAAGAVLFHDATGRFLNGTPGDAEWLYIALIFLPGLAGLFIGAPLLARDYENGTHRLL